MRSRLRPTGRFGPTLTRAACTYPVLRASTAAWRSVAQTDAGRVAASGVLGRGPAQGPLRERFNATGVCIPRTDSQTHCPPSMLGTISTVAGGLLLRRATRSREASCFKSPFADRPSQRARVGSRGQPDLDPRIRSRSPSAVRVPPVPFGMEPRSTVVHAGGLDSSRCGSMPIQQSSSMSSTPIGGRGGGGSTGTSPVERICSTKDRDNAAPSSALSLNHCRNMTSSRLGHGDSSVSNARRSRSSAMSGGGFARTNSATR